PPRPGGEAKRGADPPPGRPPEPANPAARLPLPHALPVHPADALHDRGAAAPEALRRPPGRLPLGRGAQGRPAPAARTRGGVRGGSARSGARTAARLANQRSTFLRLGGGLTRGRGGGGGFWISFFGGRG